MLLALTRPVSPSLARCELTHLPRQPIDIARAKAEHATYERTLESLGVKIAHIPAAPRLPDAVFIEDTAVVLDEIAILTRPGAPSRRAELPAVARALRPHRSLLRIRPPATLDGGDVLRVARTLYVGRSSRTNADAIAQLTALTHPFGYRVKTVPITACLHLKSAATLIAPDLLLVNPAWLPRRAFPTLDRLAVHPSEPYAANALLLNRTLIYPAHFPRTADRLARRGIPLIQVPCAELAKAEAAVTCCSIILQTPQPVTSIGPEGPV